KTYSVAYATRLGIGTLKIGGFAGQALASPFEDTSYFDPTRDPKTGGVYGTVAELSMPMGEGLTLGLDTGTVMEQSTFLGSMSSGALSLGQNVPTWFGGMTGTAKLGDGYSAFGGMQMGLSMPQAAAGSLITDASAVMTQSFNLGIAKEQVFGSADR